jgi:hypothetical protein
MDLLVNSFKPGTLEALVCRNTRIVSRLCEVFYGEFSPMLKMQQTNLVWPAPPDAAVVAAGCESHDSVAAIVVPT